MQSKIDFILAAINDTQGTIRSIDVKVGALLAALLLPLSFIEKILGHLIHISVILSMYAAFPIGIIFFITWFVALFSLARTISAIDNPRDHIVNSKDHKGSFYGAGLYKFGWLDILLNRKIIKADKDVSAFSQEYPETEKKIISELSFEHIKLIYIREIKLFRLNAALKIAFIWLLLGMTIYSYSKLG